MWTVWQGRANGCLALFATVCGLSTTLVKVILIGHLHVALSTICLLLFMYLGRIVGCFHVFCCPMLLRVGWERAWERCCERLFLVSWEAKVRRKASQQLPSLLSYSAQVKSRLSAIRVCAFFLSECVYFS